MRIFAIALIAAFATAQEPALPTPLTADLDALARRVDAAHHPKGPVEPVTAFVATLELQVVDAKAAQGGQVDLSVKYLEYHPDKTKVRHLIRYEVKEAGTPIERGRDRFGFWDLFQGKARSITEAQPQDRAACERDTNLARQLIRFLEPGAVLRALTAPSTVRDEALQRGREKPTECQVVEGDLSGFPLLQQAGEDAPVHAKIYVTKANGQLLAIEVTPRKPDGTLDLAHTELVHLLGLHEQDGFLVPRELFHSQRGDDARLRLQTTAVVTTLTLRPNLRAEDFDRPKS
jgi:hypothetical protein